MENIQSELISTFKYNKETATEYQRSRGRCTYCGVDILSDWRHYALAAIDHLLPKSLFPELAMEQDNLVLSCAACNSVKRDFNPLPEVQKNEDVRRYLQSNRQRIIEISQEYVSGKVKTIDDQRRRILELIRGT